MGRKQLILKPGPNGKGVCLCRASRIPKCIPEEVVKAILDADCLSDFLFLIKVEDFKQIELLVGNIGYALDRNNPNTAYFIASRTSDGNYEISYTNTNDDEVRIDLSDLLKDSNYNAWEVDGDYYNDLTPYMGAIAYDGRELSESNSHQWFRTLTVDGRAVFFKGMFNGLSLESITYNPNGADLSTDAEAPIFDFKLTRVDKTQPLNVSNANNVSIVKKLVGISSGAIAVYMPSESVPEPLRHFADSDKANSFPTMHTGYDGVCMVFSASVRSDKKVGSFTDAKALFTFGEPIKYADGLTAIELYYNSLTRMTDISESNTYTLNKGDFIVNSPDSEHNGYDLNIALVDGSALSGKLDATYMLVNSDGADVAFEEKLLAVSEGATSVKITVPEGKTVSIRQNGDESVALVFTYSETIPNAPHGWHDTVRDALIAYDESYGSYTFTEKDVSAMSDDSVNVINPRTAGELKNFTDRIAVEDGTKIVVLSTYNNKITVDHAEVAHADLDLGGISVVELNTSGTYRYAIVTEPSGSRSFMKVGAQTGGTISVIRQGVSESSETKIEELASLMSKRTTLDWTTPYHFSSSNVVSNISHATTEYGKGYMLDAFASAKSLESGASICCIKTILSDGKYYLAGMEEHVFTSVDETYRFSNETPIFVFAGKTKKVAVWDRTATDVSESLEDTIQSLGGEYATASVANTFDCSTIKQTGDYAMGLETEKVSDDRQGITVLSNVPETALLQYDAKLITVDVVDGLYYNPSVEEINVDATTCDLAKVSFDTSGSKVYALYSYNYMANPRTSDIERFDAVASGFALTGNSSTDKNTVSRYFGYHSYLSGNGISGMIDSIELNNYCLVSDEGSANTFITGPVSVKGFNADITDMTPNNAIMKAVKFKLVGGKYYIEDDSFTIDAPAGEWSEGAGVTTSTVIADALLLIPGTLLECKLKVWNSNVEEPLFDGENDDLLYQRAIAYHRNMWSHLKVADEPLDGSTLTDSSYTALTKNTYYVLKNPPANIMEKAAFNYVYYLGVEDGYITRRSSLHDSGLNLDIEIFNLSLSNVVYIVETESVKLPTAQEVADFELLSNGIDESLDSSELATAVQEHMTAVNRLTGGHIPIYDLSGLTKVTSAIVERTSAPIFISGKAKAKLISTDGSDLAGTSYGVQIYELYYNYSKKKLLVRPAHSSRENFTVGKSTTLENNNGYRHIIVASTLVNNVSLKVWNDGEEEPRLDWEPEQPTPEPDPEPDPGDSGPDPDQVPDPDTDIDAGPDPDPDTDIDAGPDPDPVPDPDTDIDAEPETEPEAPDAHPEPETPDATAEPETNQP